MEVSLRNTLLGIPSTRLPIDGTKFVSYVLPPLVCGFAIAVLAVTPRTRVFRVALWPLVMFLSARAALSVDFSHGVHDRTFLNIGLILTMFSLVVRTLDWTLTNGPLVRHLHPANTAPSTLMDALDLASNLRGYGWEWSYRLYIPRETRPANRTAFVLYTFLSAVAHNLMCGALHRAVLTLSPLGSGPIPGGSTIFDETLSVPIQYLRASIISVISALVIYAVLRMGYDLVTIPAILFLGQDPAQWPPIFEAPWFATSLNEFWGRRWHQWFRQTFLIFGGYPLSFVLGRVGIVIGTFLASGVIHHSIMITLNHRTEPRWMLVGFGMMGPGILLERAFYRLTGRKVDGIVGWVWMVTWLLLWGHMIVEGFARAGMFGSAGYVDSVLPVRIPVEHLVADFDAWLHTI